MKRLAAIVILLFIGRCSAANVFTGDPNWFNLWRFENGANFRADDGPYARPVGGGTATVDTNNFKEGISSASWSGSGGAVGGGFPSGHIFASDYAGATRKITSCLWFRVDSLPSAGNQLFLGGMWHSAFNRRTYYLGIINDSGTVKLVFGKGYNSGASAETTTHDSGLSTGVWYHAGVSYDDGTGAVRIRIWNDTAGAILGTDKTATHTNLGLNPQEDIWEIGNLDYPNAAWNGNIDEWVIFDKVLTPDEIDMVRDGTYPTGSSSPANWWWRRRHSKIPDGKLWAATTPWLAYHYGLDRQMIPLLEMRSLR